jgi:hypothetical protein
MLNVAHYAQCLYADCQNAECHLCRVSFMLDGANKPIMLSIIMLSIISLSAIYADRH